MKTAGSVDVFRRGICKAIGLLPVALANPWELLDEPSGDDPVPVLRAPAKIWTPADPPPKIPFANTCGFFQLYNGDSKIAFEGVVTAWQIKTDTADVMRMDSTWREFFVAKWHGSLDFIVAGEGAVECRQL